MSIYESRVRQTQQENDELRRRLQELGDANRKLAEYDNRIALLSQEIERLNTMLRSKVEELSGWESRFRALQQENDGLRRSQGQM